MAASRAGYRTNCPVLRAFHTLLAKRLYWNCRVVGTGRRRQQTPYGLLGVRLPAMDWWELLRLPPEQLRQKLSAPGLAALESPANDQH
jgi:hypothetical protein